MKRAFRKSAVRHSRSRSQFRQGRAKMAAARRTSVSKRKRSVRDLVLERFDSGKSIVDCIDFSAGKFVRIA